MRLDLPRAHARAGDRISIAAYLGKTDKFDRAIADFAEIYPDQNDRDRASLAAAVDSGESKRSSVRDGLSPNYRKIYAHSATERVRFGT